MRVTPIVLKDESKRLLLLFGRPEAEANGYKYWTQGLIGLGGLNINFSVFANENPQEAEQRGLEIMRPARHAPAK